MMNKEKRERLKWFLDFIYLDLDKCSRFDLSNHINRLDNYIFAETLWSWDVKNTEPGSGEQKNTAQSLITPLEELPDQINED